MSGRNYSAAEILYLAGIVEGRSYDEIRRMFNARFGAALTLDAVKGTLTRCGLKNGRDGRIKPGNVPHNKGLKGVSYPGAEATQFKVGNRPPTYRPVGSECDRNDGYTWVKTADPRTWRQKHILVWEAAHGPVPPAHVVTFADGDRRNFALDNLILISRAELAMMNKFGLFGGSAELTVAGKAVADLIMKIAQRGRKTNA